MGRILGRRTRIVVLAAAIILVSFASLTLRFVLAPPPAASVPMQLSQYGVVRVYASILFTGSTKIKVTTDGSSPFFISRLTLFLNKGADYDVLLDSIDIDGTGAIQISGYSPNAKVVVVPAGLTFGDIVESTPSYLSMLLVKDPMGNDAIVATGGADAGVVIGIRFMSGAYSGGATITAIATVVAPLNATVTITMS